VRRAHQRFDVALKLIPESVRTAHPYGSDQAKEVRPKAWLSDLQTQGKKSRRNTNRGG
jgi:hypothetical protein